MTHSKDPERRSLPFEPDELHEMRRRHRELLLSITPSHLSETLNHHGFKKVRGPDDLVDPRWIGAEFQVRRLVDDLLKDDPTGRYATACIALHTAEVHNRALDLIEALEFAEPLRDAARARVRDVEAEWTKAVREIPEARRVVGQLTETLLLAELVARDHWDFAPLRTIRRALST